MELAVNKTNLELPNVIIIYSVIKRIFHYMEVFTQDLDKGRFRIGNSVDLIYSRHTLSQQMGAQRM